MKLRIQYNLFCQEEFQNEVITILAMTANVIKEEIETCLSEGMNGHISKPIDFHDLGVQLKKWLLK